MKIRKSKKEDLSEFNLCAKDQSSEDNVETESLISLKDDVEICNCEVEGRCDCLFKPHTSSFPDENKINKGLFTQQNTVGELDHELNSEPYRSVRNTKTQLQEGESAIVGVKREVGGQQVFSTSSSTKHIIVGVKKEEIIVEENDKNKTEQVNKTSYFFTKKTDQLYDKDVENIQQTTHTNKKQRKSGNKKLNKSRINERAKMLTNITRSSCEPKSETKDEVSKQIDNINNKIRHGSLDVAHENGILHKDSRRDSIESRNRSTSEDIVIRADQFNKVCPSPFANAPGFRRSQSIQHKQLSKVESTISKSASLDGVKISLKSSTLVGREKWIQFEENQGREQANDNSEDGVSQADVSNDWVVFGSNEESLNENGKKLEVPQAGMPSSEEDYEVDAILSGDESKLLVDKKAGEGQLKKGNTLNKSVENLLDTVKTTVNLLKGSLTNPDESEDALIKPSIQDDDSSSLISDGEIISLEFDTDEEKLRDTPVKQFPDVSLFQVSVVGTDRDNLRLELNKETEFKIESDRDNVLDEYPPVVTMNSWKFWYRYPDKKKKVGSRKWLPVFVYIDNEILKIKTLSDVIPEIKKEIPLHPFYNFTVPIIHKGNKDGSVYSVKLQYVKYKEKRRVKTKLAVEHVPVYTPVVKLSCRDILALRKFMIRVEGIIRHMSTHRDKGISYDHEEIFIDSEDECSYLISSEGNILKYNTSVQLRLRCFVSGNPELKLFLNDINNKEILSRTKEALVRENGKTSTHWIKPELYEYHPCVDTNKSQEEGGVVFTPPDGCSFELLRFRLRKRNPLPIIAKTSLEVLGLRSLHIKSEMRVNGDGKSIRHKRNNVIFYIPVPPSWSKLFLKARGFGRTAKYLGVKVSQKSNESAKITNSRVTFKVSAGSVCYEPAYGAITWRLGTLPIMQGGLPADATHTFECSLELPFPVHVRDDFQPYAYLEFNVKQPMGSKVSVEEILLSDGRVPEKWVCYRSSYLYEMEMRILEDGVERKKSE